MKKKIDITEYRAWLSIGTDHNPIGIAWYRDHLQNNVRHIRVAIVPLNQFKKLIKNLKAK